MINKTILTFLISTISLCCSVYQEPQLKEQQYYREPQSKDQQYYREPLPYKDSSFKQPPPRILSHKQAQSHDGGFKFAYTAENGQAHSEVISPDGTRNGGYTYVDPHGKTISVKYTAGKDGFRILEGDHIPREAAAGPPAPAPKAEPYVPAAPQQSYQPQTYQPQAYQRPQFIQPHYAREDVQYKQYEQKPQYIPQRQAYASPQPQPRQYTPIQDISPTNSVEENKEPDYHDEPGKPYSFGAGYSFQFAG